MEINENQFNLIKTEWKRLLEADLHDFTSNQQDVEKDQTENNEKLNFFCYDLIDFPPIQEITLIGKRFNPETNIYESCSVRIQGIPQIFYILPKPKAKLTDILEEFKEKFCPDLETLEIYCRVVNKYNLDNKAPRYGKYLEITCKRINLDVFEEKGETFQVFGIKSDYIQKFLLEREIKGPCWLEINNFFPTNNKFTKCDQEIVCNNIEDVEIIKNTSKMIPIRVLIFNIKTIFNNKANKSTIVLISWIFCEEFNLKTQKFLIKDNFCGIYSNKTDKNLIEIEKMKIFFSNSEKSLLETFLNAFESYNIDAIISYDLTSKILDLLYEKISIYNLNLSYLTWKKFKSNIKEKYKEELFLGKLLFDLKILMEKIIKTNCYSLSELIKTNLNLPLVEINEDLIKNCFSDEEKLIKLGFLSIWETYLTLKLTVDLNLIPFTLELSKICGCLWNKTLKGSISLLCEHLLLHLFHGENYIIPDNLYQSDLCENDDISKLIGGLILEPKTGFHNNYVISMDFFSLYPSIIREFNVCFSTFSAKNGESFINNDENISGVLPKLIRELHQIRKEKQSDQSPSAQIQQSVIKKITNGLYGYLSYEKSKFYSKQIAEFITKTGREILTKTVNTIEEEFNYEVIYGDTDSVMFKINPKEDDLEQVIKIAETVKNRINSDYKHISIEISSIFKPFLILSKKKYTGIDLFNTDKDGFNDNNNKTNKFVYKGLEIVRRDFPMIVKKLQIKILNEIFENRLENVSNVLKKFVLDLNQTSEGYFCVNEFGITKKLNKNPRDYLKQSHPYVSLAFSELGKKMNLKKDDYITYVYCRAQNNVNNDENDVNNEENNEKSDENNKTQIYHLEEVINNHNFIIDKNYYLESFIEPMVVNLLGYFNISRNKIRESLDLKVLNAENNIKIEKNPVIFDLICIFCRKNYKSKLINLNSLKGCQNCQMKLQKPVNLNLPNYLNLFLRLLLIKYLNNSKINNKSNQEYKLKEILDVIKLKLEENLEHNLLNIIQNMINFFEFDLESKNPPFSLKKTKLNSKNNLIYCIFCQKSYYLNFESLVFLKTFCNCEEENFYTQKNISNTQKNISNSQKNNVGNFCILKKNYLTLVILSLIKKCYKLSLKCNNLCCKATSSRIILNQNEKIYCEICQVSYFQEENSNFIHIYESLQKMSEVLENQDLNDLNLIVKKYLMKFEYSYFDFEVY